MTCRYKRAKYILDLLIQNQLLPKDSLVLSCSNNFIIESPSLKIISRVNEVAAMKEREDPGDLIYAHRCAWELSRSAPIVRPINHHPNIYKGIVISSYPTRCNVNWSKLDIAYKLSLAIYKLNNTRPIDGMRTLNVEQYASNRLIYCQKSNRYKSNIVDAVLEDLYTHNTRYPFIDLVRIEPGVVHGDLHATNVVLHGTSPEFIDMDSVAIGPKLYDIASWTVRYALGDKAPLFEILQHFKDIGRWDQEIFSSLMGWKILSSMTHILRYEKNEKNALSRLYRLYLSINTLDAIDLSATIKVLKKYHRS